MLRAFPNVVLAVFLAGALALPAADAVAQEPRQQRQEAPEPKYRIPGTPPEPDRTGRQSTLTERTFNRLSAIHEQIGEERYREALPRLQDLLGAPTRGNDYERALVLQNLGFVLVQLERYDEAIERFHEALRIDALSHNETQQMLLYLGQLFMMQERWDDVIRMMARYFYWEENPSPEALITLAGAYAQTERHREAIPWTERAIEASRTPRENWYQLLLAMHIEIGNYNEAADVQAQMIALWPDKVLYWRQLASILMVHLNREADALAVMSVAYQRGLLEREEEILNLVRFYMYRGAPYKAARILADALESGNAEGTRANWELLSQAYQMAQESQHAISALQRAARLADTGELFVREAQLHAEVDNWQGVQRAAQRAVEMGGLRNPGRAHMMIGIAAYEQKRYAEALRAFRLAAQHADSRQNANQWIQYINHELRTQRELREGI